VRYLRSCGGGLWYAEDKERNDPCRRCGKPIHIAYSVADYERDEEAAEKAKAPALAAELNDAERAELEANGYRVLPVFARDGEWVRSVLSGVYQPVTNAPSLIGYRGMLCRNRETGVLYLATEWPSLQSWRKRGDRPVAVLLAGEGK